MNVATVNPWALNLREFQAQTVDGFGMVDDYGDLFYVPWGILFRFFVQGQ